MHIPDGFLDAKVAGATAALSVAGVGLAVRSTRLRMPPRKIPLMGLSAAFIFAAQMLNFPVAGGTSGHLVGGVLAAVLLGPAAGILVLTSVLIVQAFVFADGGILSLGANVFNMAIVSCVGGYFIYALVRRIIPGERGKLAAVAFASWCATVLAAIVCAGQLSLSNTTSWSVALAAMMNVHMLIGVGEAIITTLVVFAVMRSRPDLIADQANDSTGLTTRFDLIGYALLVALGLAAFVGPFACPWPDGLDRVSQSLGFSHRAAHLVQTPMADYRVPGIGSITSATALAGMIGVVLAFALGLLLAFMLVPRAPQTSESR